MIQEWYCETCNTLGSIRIRKHIDVLAGIHSVTEAHQRRRPECSTASKVRIRAPRCSQREWNKITHRKENAARDRAGDKLIRATAEWVDACGGKALVAGGIGIVGPGPFGRKYNFQVVISVTGHPPKKTP